MTVRTNTNTNTNALSIGSMLAANKLIKDFGIIDYKHPTTPPKPIDRVFVIKKNKKRHSKHKQCKHNTSKIIHKRDLKHKRSKHKKCKNRGSKRIRI